MFAIIFAIGAIKSRKKTDNDETPIDRVLKDHRQRAERRERRREQRRTRQARQFEQLLRSSGTTQQTVQHSRRNNQSRSRNRNERTSPTNQTEYPDDYVPPYTINANENDMGYYDSQGNFHFVEFTPPESYVK